MLVPNEYTDSCDDDGGSNGDDDDNFCPHCSWGLIRDLSDWQVLCLLSVCGINNQVEVFELCLESTQLPPVLP